jgi:hypothetical protein
MLTTRPSKRDKVGVFNTDLMFDIMDGETPIGTLVYNKKVMKAALTFGASTYSFERATDRPDEKLYQALVRVLTGAEKPPVNPWALKDGAGKILALAEQAKASFAVSHGNGSFVLRKKGRPFQLVRHGEEVPLGSVGQEKFFTRTLHMRLPDALDRPFQVFLLALVLTYTLQEMEKSTT